MDGTGSAWKHAACVVPRPCLSTTLTASTLLRSRLMADVHPGILNDQLRAALIPKDERCERCDGTGNELYAMYRQCSDCGGSGKAADNLDAST